MILFFTIIITPFCFFLGLLVLGGIYQNRKIKLIPSKISQFRKFYVLIPAHNEQDVIATTIKSIQNSDYPKDHFNIYVVADNCTDTTAIVAESFGARTFTRCDPNLKGKGYALEYGFSKLKEMGAVTPDDIYLVIDADSQIEQNVLSLINLAAEGEDNFFQIYDTVANVDDHWRTKLMNYAFSLFNGVWQLGSAGLGIGAHLRGNGMAFRASALELTPWKASSLAEDLEFSWHIRSLGHTVRFLPKALVSAVMPTSSKTSSSQRLRWENGRKALRKQFTPKMTNFKCPPFKKLLFLLDLWMPALSTVGVYSLLIFVANIYLCLIFEPRNFDLKASFSLILSLLNVMSLCAYLVSPFFLMKLPKRYVLTLFMAPYYALWRMGIVLQKAPKLWVRTPREKK